MYEIVVISNVIERAVQRINTKVWIPQPTKDFANL